MHNRSLTTFYIMPLIPGHEAELAADAERLLASGVCTEVACMMTLVPESDPPEDKAQILGERFLAFRRAFKGDAARVGILAQATIGHGWMPEEPASYQKIIRPDRTGVSDVSARSGIPGIHPQRLPSSRRPRAGLLHDRRRLPVADRAEWLLLPAAPGGNRPPSRAGVHPRILLEALRQDSAAARAYDTLLLDSLLQLAGVIRTAIDEIDPAIPGSFCACYGDIRHAGALARRLAGAGHLPVIRINNARYLTAEMRSFPVRMYHGAAQIAALDPDITIIAETDPFPHNRYSTSRT